METHPSKYRYEIWTRAGSCTIELAFVNNNAAHINIASDGMGSHMFSCLHQSLSKNHGFLRVIKIDDIETGEEIYAEPFVEYGEDIYGLYLSVSGFEVPEVEIVFEYIKLQQSEMHMSGDRTLDNMRFKGSAEWIDTFDMFLFLLPLTNVPEESVVHNLISGIDKIKLTSTD